MQNNNEVLRVLHTVYNNTLEPLQDTLNIAGITTHLYPHQNTLIHGMHEYRKRMTEGLRIDNDEIKAKIGIIAEQSGSGKTLAILGYLASDTYTYPSFELTQYSSPYFYSQKKKHPQNSSNLIIVPSNLLGHWEDEIKKHTTLSYVIVDTRGKLKDGTRHTILSSTFVLTTNKCYRHVQEYSVKHNITWNNICMDEPLFIQLKSSDPLLQFQFLWFISYQWTSLLFRNSIKKSQLLFLQEPMHSDLEEMLLDNTTEDVHIFPSQYIKQYLSYNHPDRGHIILRNLNEHIRITPIPEINHSIIHCKATTTLQSLSSLYLARNNQLRSSNIPHLFQALGIESHTQENYTAHHEEKRDIITRKIEENECGICFDSCVYPTIINCCFHVYCAKCILQNTLIQFKCPTCRTTLDTTKMSCLSSLGETALRSKKEACLEIMNVYDKCIVYISLDKIYYDLLNDMQLLGLKSELVTSFSLRKSIKNLRDGNTDVLFVSKVELIRGLSMPSVSCLLFYHEQPIFEQKQALLNMVQQMNREQPLQIVYLYSEIQV
jgi:hypothetical protein